jgi:hypothetical protein
LVSAWREQLRFYSAILTGLPTVPDNGERITRLIEANANKRQW